jgi:uncharacterized repeat protein (TIGR03803 family)
MHNIARRITRFVSENKTSIRRGSTPSKQGKLASACFLIIVLAALTHISAAQSNFTVLATFTGSNGGEAIAGPTLDSHGNLYGTTWGGGPGQAGTAYQLKQEHGSWILNVLSGLSYPYAGITVGPDGTLFGADAGGGPYGVGVVYRLQPPPTACESVLCLWNFTLLHDFTGAFGDGAVPDGNLVFDSQGNFYGTTNEGGQNNGGTVYEGTRSGGTWNVSTIYSFAANSGPYAGLILDSAGNLYGTTLAGGEYDMGTVFELTPSQGGWTEVLLHSFSGSDGCGPSAGVVFDRAGNLYGATANCGTIFELSPQGNNWNLTTLYSFPPDGGGPDSSLTLDSAGNLYGTNPFGGNGNGNVFELSPLNGGGWTYTDLYDFTGGSDGLLPQGSVAVTAPNGYLYGTAYYTVFRINLGADR